MKKRYAIVIEKAKNNYSAFVPDVDGCVAAAKTVQGTKALMQEALEFHFEAMADDGDFIPEPTSVVDYVEVEVPEPAARKAL
jgi:predicted RNase H-like HicB family nuclease